MSLVFNCSDLCLKYIAENAALRIFSPHIMIVFFFNDSKAKAEYLVRSSDES
jgi:hypothetical protein